MSKKALLAFLDSSESAARVEGICAPNPYPNDFRGRAASPEGSWRYCQGRKFNYTPRTEEGVVDHFRAWVRSFESRRGLEVYLVDDAGDESSGSSLTRREPVKV